MIILGLTLPSPDSTSLHLANLQQQSHIRGGALQFAVEPAVLRLQHQHRDDIPGFEPQQGPVGTRRVGHNGLNSCCATPLSALAATAGLTKGTRTGRTARREQTCGETNQGSGWSLASSCKTHTASKDQGFPSQVITLVEEQMAFQGEGKA